MPFWSPFHKLPTRPPVERCIYCDSTEEPLTKEHVIPKSLRGVITLPRASCPTHSRLTQKMETEVGRTIFGDVRRFLGFRIKEPHKHRLQMKDKAHLLLADFEAAGFLRDQPPGATTRMSLVPFEIRKGDFQMWEKLPLDFERQLDPNLLARFLAKVALGLAVVHVGIDGFVPLIRGVITGDDPDWMRWVGGTPPELVALPDADGHQVGMFIVEQDSKAFIAAQFRLLNQSLPTYTVVVGELLDTGRDNFRSFEEAFQR